MAKTKVVGFRVSPEKIKEFEDAFNSLPVNFKPTELLRGYIDYIISTANDYKKTGHVKMGFLSYDKNIIICNLEGRQVHIDFEEEMK